jgi:hypothetical protein
VEPLISGGSELCHAEHSLLEWIRILSKASHLVLAKDYWHTNSPKEGNPGSKAASHSGPQNNPVRGLKTITSHTLDVVDTKVP